MTHRNVLVSAVALTLSIIACAPGASEEAASSELAATPGEPTSMFDQVKTCDGHVRFKVGVRAADLEGGVVRWKCGDVDGVDLSDGRNDFGQEYCEYHALVNGTNVDASSDPPAGDVKCVYTSAFTDSSIVVADVEKALQKQMSLTEAPPRNVVKMQNGVNSRHAARVLIDDCAAGASSSFVNAERQTACFTAWKAAGADLKGKLRTACRGVDLSADARWKVVADLGVKELSEMPAGDEVEVMKDVAACAQSYDVVLGKPGAVVLWRNSDPTICGRILRAAHECGDTFKSLDDAKALQGFALTSWNDDHDPATPPQVPSAGCQYAEVDGKPFEHGLVCTPPKKEVAQAKLDGKPMQVLCNDLFGGEIAMAAPVGAVSVAGKKEETTFCKAFHAGATALGGGK